MKSRTLTCITAMTLFAALAIPVQLPAQHTQYKLIDLGTLGGPIAYGSVNGSQDRIINNAGVVSFSAATPIADPFAPNCYFPPACFVTHAVSWSNGVVTDLGALPGNGNGSASGAINAQGWIAGQGENGEIDPVSGLPETRSILWKGDQKPIDLGTLGGNWSLATNLNNGGQVVGFATDGIPDPFSMFLDGTQTRAFQWQKGVLQDLGTLGGPDAEAFSVNERGQVVGFSYTNATPNDRTGIPTIHPFLWDHGRMTDLGTLGGTYAGTGSCSFAVPCNVPPLPYEGTMIVNNRGQVIGTSNLAGDQIFHPFLWDHGKMTDLGTLGGDTGVPIWLTNSGEVVGEADLPPSPPGCAGPACIHHAFLWNNGVMIDLGTVGADACSRAVMMNSKGQIVGHSIAVCGFEATHAFLWEKGGPMVDLNTLIPANAGAVLYEAESINEQGEIVAAGLPAGCGDRSSCGHIYLLIPCNGNGYSGCENGDAPL